MNNYALAYQITLSKISVTTAQKWIWFFRCSADTQDALTTAQDNDDYFRSVSFLQILFFCLWKTCSNQLTRLLPW
jgi:hypothetical protein